MARGAKRAAVAAGPVEGPWKLPEGWRWERLGHLCDYVSRGRGPKYVSEGGVRVVNQRCVRWDRVDLDHCKRTDAAAAERLSPEQYLQDGDILWNSTGTGTIGRAAIFRSSGREPLVADSHVTIVRLRETDPRWVHHWISTHAVQQAVTGVGSTNQVELAKQLVLELPVPCADADLQRRTLQRIDELFADIDEGEAALAAARADLERYGTAVLFAVATGKARHGLAPTAQTSRRTGAELLASILERRRAQWGESVGSRKAYREPCEPDCDGLPELPPSWCWASLDQVCSVVTSGSRAWAPYYDRGNATFIMAQNVRPGRYDDSSRQFVDPPEDDPERRRTQVHRGDLLLTIVGANTGDLCQVTFDPEEHFVCQSVALLRPVEPQIGAVAELFFAGQFGRALQMDRLIYGAGRPHLSFDQIRSLAVPIPPFDEVPELLATAHRMLREQHVAGLDEINPASLRQSILAAAFRGDLMA